MERASYDDIAFRYLCADQHPDHDTIADFRRQHLPVLAQLFTQVLQLCDKAGALWPQ
jgi:transposase